MIKEKTLAALLHLFLSALIFSLFIIFLRNFWYPEPFFTASGGWQGLKIVAIIDLVLGPLLTFIAFSTSKAKKTLKADLSIILIIQLSALIWGIHTVYNQRPVAVTFWENSFYTVPYQIISNHYLESTKLNELVSNPRQLFIVLKPKSIDAIKQLNNEVISKQLPPYQLIERYTHINDHFDQIKPHSVDINKITSKNSDMNSALMTILKTTKSKTSDNIYIPLISRYQNIILIFSDNGTLLGSIKAPLKAAP